MKLVVPSLGCALLLASCSAEPKQRTVLDGPAVIETTQCRDDFLVEVLINGTIPATMLIDTGAPGLMVDFDIAEQIADTENEEITFMDAVGNEIAATELGRLSQVQIGALTVFDVEAFAMDLEELSGAMTVDIDGILGFPLFADVLLTLDYPGKQVRVAHGSIDQEESMPMFREYPVPIIELKLGDTDVPFCIDSGSSHGFSVPGGGPLHYVQDPIPTSAGMALGGIGYIFAARLDDSVTLAGVRYDEPVIEVSTVQPLLGTKILRRYEITFDQRNARVRFVRGDGEPDVVRERGIFSLGFIFARIDGEYRVLWVLPDSYAHGLIKEGDIIVSVNGAQMSEFGCDGLDFSLRDTVIAEVVIHRSADLSFYLPVVELVP